MKKTISEEKLPIKIWVDEVEEEALQQARNLANLPFAFKWIALMPDVHVGFGMPIGGVMAARDVVVPNAVGVDIGCGVLAYNTGLSTDEFLPLRDKVMNRIMRDIPLGFKHHKKPRKHELFSKESQNVTAVVKEQWERAKCQIGTLGGGNHFVEIQKDEHNAVWVMIHSGSRNLGKQVADHYNKLAKKTRYNIYPPLPKNFQLDFLMLNSKEGRDYMQDMSFCVKFARANRELMMERVAGVFSEFFTRFRYEKTKEMDVRHNYAAIEKHFGEQVVVHRKGAVKAKGTVVIPGSMGTFSYIGEGLENPESFCSCAHGAGRKLSRKQAKKTIKVENVMKEMDAKNIKLFTPNKSDVVDESSASYKNIDEVMENQKDLVKIKRRLLPLGVIKA